jgi:hypothetical protein
MKFRESLKSVGVYGGVIVFYILCMVNLFYTPTEVLYLPGSYGLFLVTLGVWQWLERKLHLSAPIDPQFCIKII